MTKDKLTFTIDLNNLTFKDIVYLSLQAEEEGSLSNTMGSFSMEYANHDRNSIEYCYVRYDDEGYDEAYKFIVDSKEFLSIKNELDIKKLKSIDFEVVNGFLNTNEVKEILKSGIINIH